MAAESSHYNNQTSGEVVMKIFGGSTAAASLIAIAMSSAFAADGKAYDLNIAPQDLATALRAFSNQTELQLIYSQKQIEGQSTDGIQGTVEAVAGLEKLLEKSGLSLQQIDEKTFAVKKPKRGEGAALGQLGNTQRLSMMQEGNAQGPATERAGSSAAGTSAGNDGSQFLEEIIVTVQKRAQNLQDVPISITAFSGDALERQGLVSLREIARFTPGFASSTFNESEPIFAVRGAFNTFSQAGASKPVGVFLDDVYISRNTASAFELYDLEQIAILRGPQGTLFGRNVTGGAIMIQTSRPSLEESVFKMEVGYGNYNAIDLRALASGPVGDRVAAKLSATYRTRDGYGRERLLDLEQNDLETFNIRGQILFELSDNLEARLTLDYSEDENNGRTLSTTSPANADDGDIRTSEHGVEQFYDRKTFGITAHLDWDAEAGTLSSITAYRESDTIENFAFSSTSFTFLPSFNPFFPFQQIGLNADKPETFSEELRWVSSGKGPFSYVIGLYYFSENISRQSTSIRLAGVTGNTIRNQTFDESVDTESFAIYTDVEFAITEKLKLNLGGRYTWEEKKIQVDFANALNSASDFQSPDFQESWSEFTPRAVLTWQPSDSVSLYGSFTEGFTSGGFNTEEDTVAVIGRPFDPETIQAYELGAKTEFLDRKIRLNVALFRQDYKNKQEGFLDPTFNFVIVNAAKARMKGIEVELHWALNEFFTLHGSYSYLDAVYRDFVIPGSMEDRTGNFLSTSPKNSLAFGADFRHPLGDIGYVFANASYTKQGSYFTGSDNRDTFLIDSYDLVDASVGFESEDETWRVTLWVKNLTDEEYVLIRSDFGLSGVGEHFGQPRMYGIKATASF